MPLKNRENLKISIEKPYILYVGGRSKYKNFNLFIEAFSKSKKFMIILISFVSVEATFQI